MTDDSDDLLKRNDEVNISVMAGILLALLIAAVTVILVLAFVWNLSEMDLAVVRLPREGGTLLAAGELGPGEFVSLSYRHSVELTRVEGRFKIGPGPELVAWQTRQASVGTGLPNTYPERTKIEDGWLVIDEQMRPIGRVRFYIVPINKTRLLLAGQEVDLSRLREGSLIQLTAERINRLEWFLWTAFNRPWSEGEA